MGHRPGPAGRLGQELRRQAEAAAAQFNVIETRLASSEKTSSRHELVNLMREEVAHMAKEEMHHVQETYLADLDLAIGRILHGLHDPKSFFAQSRGSVKRFREMLVEPAFAARKNVVACARDQSQRRAALRSHSVDITAAPYG